MCEATDWCYVEDDTRPLILPANEQTRPQGYKTFSCSTRLSTKFQLLIKTKTRQMKKFLALSLSDVVFIMLINILTIVGILTFMSMMNFVLSRVEHKTVL